MPITFFDQTKSNLIIALILFTMHPVFQGCDIDGEPPPPSESIIMGRHFDISGGAIYKTEREGNTITYYGSQHRPVRQRKYTFEVIPTKVTQYIIVYELIGGEWVHISTDTY